MSPENKKYIISLQKKNKKNKYGSQYNTQESKRNMNNIKTGKDSNTNNESSDDEKITGENKQSFELGTMFTATRKANNKMVKKVTTQDYRIINTNKTSTREKYIESYNLLKLRTDV